MAAKPRRSYGTGSLIERPDSAGRVSWYGQWYDNKRLVKRKIGPKRPAGSKEGLTKSAAERELRRRMAQEVKPTPRAATTGMTIGEVGRRYLLHLENEKARKRSTRTAVESALRVHLEPFFGERDFGGIKRQEVVDLKAVLQNRGLSAKSIRNYMGTLSALFKFAMHPDRRWAAANQCDGIELPEVPDDDEIHYLQLDQVDALIHNAAPGPYEVLDRTMYRTAPMTGIREGELIALRWRDVDWIASAIRVRQNFVLEEFGTPKSKRSSRVVPMADAVAGDLERFYKERGEPSEDALVFGDVVEGRTRKGKVLPVGSPLDKAALLRRYRKALKAAGLDTTHRFHDLRHTFGTQMAAAGVPMRTLQEWMGHRDIRTTERYADYMPRSADAKLVAAAFSQDAVITPAEAGASIEASI
jgi:integrase